ncbi:RNA polymerase recycling motor ATPase HelR [Terrabacter carboxydivorans]|uniref:RNA polymerase recycling motor ATPase HelR n=1 Tax=Terrabacter carboxydivorans TaxID=619730 RepID=A0ABN3LKE3_9MICO
MNHPTTSAFDLPDTLISKSDPALIGHDDAHFAAIAETMARDVAELSDRLDAVRRAPARTGQAALDRDQEVHRLTARLRTLRRFGLDLCLGHMLFENDSHPIYVGRLGLTDAAGERLLVDWRSPAAEPFFGATHGYPMGLTSRRRYRWTRDRVSDYWDEVFTPEGLEGRAALDDESAFIASLGASRSPRMRDVLATIQADQDAIIRAGSRGALVVDGGPGTGKTVVALHRTAYLLYSDPRLGHRRGGVLFVGPHEPYLSYVSDVLPSLGEEGVQTCTLRDLVPEGSTATTEHEPEVARLKASTALVDAIEPAVGLYEEPPTRGTEVVTPWAQVWLSPADWQEAFAAGAHLPHNEARDDVWEALVAIVLERHDLEVRLDDDGQDVELEATPSMVRRAIEQDRDLRTLFERSWPLLEAEDLVGDLWTVPAYLRRCAPSLELDEVRRLQRAEPDAWTVSDLPLLDAARRRLGDPEAARRRRRHDSQLAAEREERAKVVEHLIASDDSDMHVMSMLRGDDLRGALDDGTEDLGRSPDRLAGPFAHVVVDEAQELTDAEWRMLLSRCPSRSLTVVGDRAQARHGFTESWHERLARVGLDRVTIATLGVNYRTPAEVMAEAEPVIRAALPDANVPVSVRESGVPVEHGMTAEIDAVLATWLAAHDDGTACVIGDPTFVETPRVRSLTPVLAKGLEFDLVVLVDPERFGDGIEGAVDRYVAMTRATRKLVVLTDR